MDIFLEKHQESILGVIEGFDRIIFKGHLTSMFSDGAFGRYLYKRGVLLKDAGKFFESETEVLIQHAKRTAEEMGRPYRYLESAHTHAGGQSKEAMAQAIAKQDGVTEGLVCIFSVLEPCVSLGVAGNRKTQRLEVVRRNRRCLHLYWYLIDPVFGWMHVRMQTWAPYSTQIYVNGREWLCRQLQQDAIAFERSDNKIVWVSDFDATARLAEKFKHTEWPAFLIRHVAAVNPLLPAIAAAGFDGYWFGMDQAEVATDRDRPEDSRPGGRRPAGRQGQPGDLGRRLAGVLCRGRDIRLRQSARRPLPNHREGSWPYRNTTGAVGHQPVLAGQEAQAALAETGRGRHDRAPTRHQRHGLHRPRLLHRQYRGRQRRIVCPGGARSLGNREQPALGARRHVPRG